MELLTAMTSLMAIMALRQTVVHGLMQAYASLPLEIRVAFNRFIHRILSWFSAYSHFEIMDVDGVNTNELYSDVQLHLTNSPSISATRISRARNSSYFSFSLADNGKFDDKYNGVSIWWEHRVTQRQSNSFSWRSLPEEKRAFVLWIPKKNTETILTPYLEHIVEHASEIRRKKRDRLLYTNSKGGMDSRNQPWDSVPFKHPSTFDTLALDPVRKSEIIADLDAFVKGKEFYQNTGRAWKRGYLLHGRPGTGKSSMIAAMANHLCFDVYDLELTEARTNAELRKLLIKTTNKSIIVIEDIDCSLNLSERAKRPCRADDKSEPPIDNKSEDNRNAITLSGLLNFTDGLWSCCGSERIFVFTTNHIEKLDPALLRSGRMDMHILMSSCTFPALKILVKNHLGIEKHEFFPKLEEIIEDAQMTPADVSEILIKYRLNPTRALGELLEAFKAAQERGLNKEEEDPIEGGNEEQERRDVDIHKKIERDDEPLDFGKMLPK